MVECRGLNVVIELYQGLERNTLIDIPCSSDPNMSIACNELHFIIRFSLSCEDNPPT